jgi:hypothetical protein
MVWVEPELGQKVKNDDVAESKIHNLTVVCIENIGSRIPKEQL